MLPPPNKGTNPSGRRPPGMFALLDDVCKTAHAEADGVDDKFLQVRLGFIAVFKISGFTISIPVFV